MRWPLASVLALVLAACGQDPLPLPTLLSVQPTQANLDSTERLQLRVDALLPFTLRYREGMAVPRAEVEAWVGLQQLENVRDEGGGLFSGDLKPGLALGNHDVRVRLSDGREASLTKAFTIVDPYNFRVEVHGARFYKNVSFPMTLYAPGPEAWRFRGTVTLRSSVGTVTPSQSAPFESGVATLPAVTIDAMGEQVVISVEDGAGRRGQSAPFKIEERQAP
jgi:hypothetical protein